MDKARVDSEGSLTRAVLMATQIAKRAGLALPEVNKFATSVSELGRNILKYAESGEIEFQVLNTNAPGCQAIARDQGPGIPDIEKALEDHFSSSGTLGLGLPGIKRMVDEFELESEVGTGTLVRIAIHCRRGITRDSGSISLEGGKSLGAVDGRGFGGVARGAEDQFGIQCGFFIRPSLGERFSGDQVFFDHSEQVQRAALIDGLGHGMGAYEVAMRARRLLAEEFDVDPVRAVERLGHGLKGSLGAAAAVVYFRAEERTLEFAGVGNVSLRHLGGRAISFHYAEGVLGGRMRTPTIQSMVMGPTDLVVMHSDGVSDRLARIPASDTRFQKPQDFARAIVEKYGKSHDDASCIVLRCVR
jgi:anti-sigma regulatory factor (Ser/Thr protein kinase)